MGRIESYAAIKTIVQQQLEADHCLAAGDLAKAQADNELLVSAPRQEIADMEPHRRRFEDHFELRLSNYRGTTLLCAEHERVRQEINQLLAGDGGQWMGDYAKLRKINDFLTPFALQNTGTALYFTPSRQLVEFPLDLHVPQNYEVRELTPEQWQIFADDARFSNALGFNDLRPDTAVLVALFQGETVGMVGASEDSDLMWQIGIDVVPEHRHSGVGTLLVQKLARISLNRGFVPFYGTSPSHIVSQNLALRAGFEPAWWEFVSSSLLDVPVGSQPSKVQFTN